MRIALCQFNMLWEDKDANKKKILGMLDSCSKPMDWLVFSEMTLSGFTMNTEKAELSQADMAFFGEIAKNRNINVSFGGVIEGRNRLITMNRKGETLSSYSKIHLYAFGEEDKHYIPGTKSENFNLEGLSICPAVCFDLRFPYLFWNAAPKTDIYVVIAAWPARRAEHWMTLLRARAVENQCYIIGVNRTGTEGKTEYSGNSMIFDPLGKIVLDCAVMDGISVAEIDVTKELVVKTRTRFPFLNERKSGMSFS